MYAIVTVADVVAHCPRSVSSAYEEIAESLRPFGFRRVQGSVYLTDNEDMANLFDAVATLRALSWFPKALRDIRAFRVKQWSDFTPMMKRALG